MSYYFVHSTLLSLEVGVVGVEFLRQFWLLEQPYLVK